MKSDEELKKTFKIFVEKDGIINLICYKLEEESEDNGRVVEMVKDGLDKIFNEDPQKQYNIFVDLTPAGKILGAQGFSARTREIGVQIINHKQLKRSAFIAKSTIAKTIINIMVKATGKSGTIRSFSDKEEALEWFKE